VPLQEISDRWICKIRAIAAAGPARSEMVVGSDQKVLTGALFRDLHAASAEIVWQALLNGEFTRE